VALIAAMACIGCFGAGRQRPPRNAEEISAARVVGLWEGTYRARTVDRDGRFRINLEQRSDSLAGWLELLGVAQEQLRAPLGSRPTADADIVRVNFATITLDGTRMRMHSATYLDPGCGCALTLDLTGYLVADTLSGYFDATGTAVTAPERGGQWRVVRTR
jgi:hypothetical protein